jgi:transcriptional regulator with XRE-family HTH domain
MTERKKVKGISARKKSRFPSGRVRALRKRLGITQMQLKERSGVSQATISRIEVGWAHDVSGETLRRLAAALGVTTDFLASGRDRATESDVNLSDPFVTELLALVGNFDASRRTQLLDFGRYLSRRPGDPGHG